MHSVFLLEVILALATLGVVLIAPQKSFGPLRLCSRGLSRIAALPYLPLWVVGILAFVGSAALSFVLGVPEPRVHDEFSYLLAGDTFARGRLTNPSHPLWIHFESFHIIHRPTYASKFFPAQGLILAAGQVIGGHSIIGVWLSVSFASVGICWMLQAWLPRRWALIGALVCLLQTRPPWAGFLGYWSQSYWGGSMAALGGALVFGALPRILSKPRALNGFLFAAGLSILANSRPYEGSIASVLAVIWLAVSTARNQDVPGRLLLGRVVLPIVLTLGITLAAMGFYNFRITGDVTRFPYMVHKDTYMAAPLFVFQKMAAPKTYNHELIRDFHTDWELTPYLRQQSAKGLLDETGKKLATLWQFYLGPTLTVPMIVMLPFAWRSRRMRFVLATCGLLTAGLLLLNWVLPHYAAPVTGLVALLSVQGMRYLRLWCWNGKPIGRRLVYGIPCALALTFAVLFMMRIRYAVDDWNHQRSQIISQLNGQDGCHLVMVRYLRERPGYLRNHAEWVYNEPDIDGAKIVWAREMDAAHNRQLLEYFNDRHIWLLTYEEGKPGELVALRRQDYRESGSYVPPNFFQREY